jgi:hypothetical protein
MYFFLALLILAGLNQFSLRLQVSIFPAPRILTLVPISPWSLFLWQRIGCSTQEWTQIMKIHSHFCLCALAKKLWYTIPSERVEGGQSLYVRKSCTSWNNVSSLLGPPAVGCSLQISDKMMDLSDPRETKKGFVLHMRNSILSCVLPVQSLGWWIYLSLCVHCSTAHHTWYMDSTHSHQ